ncbi:MAG: hypothetical protein ABIZ91_08990 [Gemmatimonadaceae bacterium]
MVATAMGEQGAMATHPSGAHGKPHGSPAGGGASVSIVEATVEAVMPTIPAIVPARAPSTEESLAATAGIAHAKPLPTHTR